MDNYSVFLGILYAPPGKVMRQLASIYDRDLLRRAAIIAIQEARDNSDFQRVDQLERIFKPVLERSNASTAS